MRSESGRELTGAILGDRQSTLNGKLMFPKNSSAEALILSAMLGGGSFGRQLGWNWFVSVGPLYWN